MNRDQYINEVRRKSLLCIFNAMRRIIVHPLNRNEYMHGTEIRSSGCGALDWATMGRVPRYITGTEGRDSPDGYITYYPKPPKTIAWCSDVQRPAYIHWENQRPVNAPTYWWPCEISKGAVQHRVRAIDNIIKDLTPASVSRNKREGKFVGHIRFARIFGRKRMVTPAIRCHDGLYVTK